MEARATHTAAQVTPCAPWQHAAPSVSVLGVTGNKPRLHRRRTRRGAETRAVASEHIATPARPAHVPVGQAGPVLGPGPAPDTEPYVGVAVDNEDLLREKDACGVGFIANLKAERTHDIVTKALTALGCMEHRGACSSDNVSGDGAGLMLEIPWDLLAEEVPGTAQGSTGVGMVFLPDDEAAAGTARGIVAAVAEAEGFDLLGWRDVPVDVAAVGEVARATMPRIAQVVLRSRAGLAGDDLERELFIVRKLIERRSERELGPELAPDFYFCSLSCRTIVYKGMLNSGAVARFFRDLTDPRYVTCFAVYHRRYSTNTTPRWPLAQPMRLLGHNGEINTLQGNLNWVASRQGALRAEAWGGRERELLPLCDARESDSANLDHLAELLVRSGTDAREALMVLVPEAYRNHPDLAAEYAAVADFYRYYEGLQEGWDGPALLVFTDGKKVGARLDRNGLRPARFWRTADGVVYVASEVGVLGDVFSSAPNIVAKGRLGPGQMLCADLETGEFQGHVDIARDVASRHPYADWLAACTHRLADIVPPRTVLEGPAMAAGDALRLMAASGYGLEDTAMVIEGMAGSGAEPTYCMGDDVPLPALARSPHLLYDYFKQRFAQVTNPPIDPLREGLVMSLEMRLGRRGNLLSPGPDSYQQVVLRSPVLTEPELDGLLGDTALGARVLRTRYAGGSPGALAAALRALCEAAEAATRDGAACLVLSDRPEEGGAALDPARPALPPLLAVGAVHHALIRAGLRTETSLVVETAGCVSTHHLAALVGYGAHAVVPYLAFEAARQWRASPRTENLVRAGKLPDVSMAAAQRNYKKALEKGLMKILSKMGISLLSCYHGAQIFEAYGLGREVIDAAFVGTVSRIGGLTLDDVQRETEAFWAKGFPEKKLTKLEDYGYIQARPKGEHHANNQAMSKLLHKAIGLGGHGPAGAGAYEAYLQHFRAAPVTVLRDLLELHTGAQAVDVEEVESVADIVARFCTGGMSLGAISRETHETIAIAMNRLGGKSNSGEGGEDPVRWLELDGVDKGGRSALLPHLKGLRAGDTATSRIKQVASGRFGVTPEFLVNADQVEIKIAQGAKPGEGGQLPGKKVSPYIADLRRSKPGVPLISPPPHHDIYSIEDLAQLIYDLHQVNPAARVSVKLVAQAGIGTVASGVAKAGSDVIQVSGHDGGTGASPISSIKHAGGPMEMGLAEVHQTLTANGLRDRVVLRADGGMRTGRDVLVAAALGGDEFGFGTVAMIATGCIMARVCHTNNCPVGVASQREELRKRFPGTPEDLVNYFMFVAEEVRAGLASLGLRSLDELVGRGDYLRQRTDVSLAKTSALDLSILTRFAGETATSTERRGAPPHDNGSEWDDVILADAEVQKAIDEEGTVRRSYDIANTDRSALGRLGGAIAKRYGDDRFQGRIELDLRGSAGQSFACFITRGVHVTLTGEANDYVCKGMAGGEVAIRPPEESRFPAREASIVGNTCLYGATGGALFVNGRAGERFAVRNSRAAAVVEGVGDHACEYMTGGVVVVLGKSGRNVAAGMTGGLGYFYDPEGTFPDRVNAEIVTVQRVLTGTGAAQLKGLLERHVELTGSAAGQELLGDWEAALPRFWQLVPPSEANTPEASEGAEGEAGDGAGAEREPAAAASA
ncbi:GSF1 [Auxenochlorella protothecoides x Auxenochlorella symbiontica]